MTSRQIHGRFVVPPYIGENFLQPRVDTSTQLTLRLRYHSNSYNSTYPKVLTRAYSRIEMAGRTEPFHRTKGALSDEGRGERASFLHATPANASPRRQFHRVFPAFEKPLERENYKKRAGIVCQPLSRCRNVPQTTSTEEAPGATETAATQKAWNEGVFEPNPSFVPLNANQPGYAVMVMSRIQHASVRCGAGEGRTRTQPPHTVVGRAPHG